MKFLETDTDAVDLVFPCTKLKLFVTTRTNLMSDFWGWKWVKEGKKDCTIRLEKNVVPTSSSQDRCRELKQSNNCNYCVVSASYCIWKPMRKKFWKGMLQMAADMPAKSFSDRGLKPRKWVTRDHVCCYHVYRKLSCSWTALVSWDKVFLADLLLFFTHLFSESLSLVLQAGLPLESFNHL